jgi:hypothetical protein
MAPIDAGNFAAQAVEPTRADFAALRSALDAQVAVYTAKVQPIRHDVFAHAGRITREERFELFARLFTREFEQLVVFALRLHRALEHLYMNGLRLVLDHAPSVIGELLAQPVPQYTTTWEHRHVVTDTAKFFASLRARTDVKRD